MSTARFNADCKRFLVGMTEDNKKLFKRTAEQIKTSLTEGAAVTASPGQPVDTGYLKATWQIAWNAEGEWTAQIGTNCAYARVIESGGNKAEYDDSGSVADADGNGVDFLGNPIHVGRRSRRIRVPLGVRALGGGGIGSDIGSIRGGAHSWEQTRVNFDKLVDNVRAELGQQ